MRARECVLPVFVPHLGCPHACVFCDQRRISGRENPASADTVRESIRAAALPPQGTKRQLAFYGGSFTAIPLPLQTELLSAAREAIDRGEIDAVRLSTRPDAVDAETLERLRAGGVETVELGAQSMDDGVLRLSGRGHTAADVERAAQLVKAAGLRLILQMMTGLPGDTPEKSLETARRIIALAPDGVRIYPTVVVRGTALCALWERGEYREHTVEEAVSLCARLLPLFEAAGIPVVRLGLHPTAALSGGEAVAGAYHPALGELVKSRVQYERAAALLRTVPPGSVVRLTVPPRLLSQTLGQHRENQRRLREAFSLAELRICPGDEKNGSAMRVFVEKSEKL